MHSFQSLNVDMLERISEVSENNALKHSEIFYISKYDSSNRNDATDVTVSIGNFFQNFLLKFIKIGLKVMFTVSCK